MNDKLVIVICTVAALAAIGASVYLFLEMDDDGEKNAEYFGLTSTKLTMTPGDEYEMTVWDLPGDATYEDISWSSDNTSVVRVVDGRMTAVGKGTALVTATVKNGGERYSDDCLVTVTDTVTKQLLAYDAYSDDMDYAVLSGTGFEKGLLSLTFNVNGTIVISLSGYKEEWLSVNPNSIGNASNDFDSVIMSIRDSNGNIEVTRTYTNNNGKTPENGSSQSLMGDGAYTTLLTFDDAPYGKYTVTFIMKYKTDSKYVTGDFDYQPGDGRRDASGTYLRTYAWKASTTVVGTAKTCTFTQECSYADYWNSYMKCSKLMKVYNNGARDYNDQSEAGIFAADTATIDALGEKLKEVYTDRFGYTDYGSQRFAQFVLTFGQVCFSYDTDDEQYHAQDEKYDMTDVWAFSNMTQYSGYGDCEDTSLLLCTLFRSLGYDVVAVTLPSHMVMAIAFDEYDDIVKDTGYNASAAEKYVVSAEHNGKTYYFCETTVNAPIKYSNTNCVVLKSIDPLKTYRFYYLGMISYSFHGSAFGFVDL